MAKRIVKLTESDLQRIVQRVLNEQIVNDSITECFKHLEGVIEVPQECMNITKSPDEKTIMACATKLMGKINIMNGFKIFQTLSCITEKTGIQLPEG